MEELYVILIGWVTAITVELGIVAAFVSLVKRTEQRNKYD